MSAFDYYRKDGVRAVFHRVPIKYLEFFRVIYPGQYKIRYRGPRKDDNRPYLSKQSTCLKSRAVCFSAYCY